MLNRKPFLLILFTLLVLFLLPSSYVHANDIDFIKDNGDVGLWHTIAYDEESEETRAYVYMRFYHGPSDFNWIKTTYFGIDNDVGSNPTHYTNVSIYARWQPDFNISIREISAPNNFNKLTIDFRHHATTNNKSFTVSFDDVSSIKVLFDPTRSGIDGQIDDFQIYDQNDNLLYSSTRSSGDIAIYWSSSEFSEDDFIYEVHDDYTKLPDVDKNFYIIDKYQLLHKESNSYKLFMSVKGVRYSFDVSLPEFINITDYIKLDGKLNISYSTYKNDRFLYLQPDKEKKPYPLKNGTIIEPSDLHVGFITINLSENTYEIIKNLKINTVINKESNAEAFAYLMFDIPIEDIYNISFEYSYRLKYFGIAGKWHDVTQIYAKDDPGESHPVWWLYLTPLTAIASVIFDKMELLNNHTIKSFSYNSLPNNVIDTYLKDFENVDIDTLKNSTHYRIFLGQFSAFGSTNYDISVKKIVDITYQYQGIVYNVPYPLIDHDVKNPDSTPVLNELDFKDFFKFEGVNDFGTFLSHLFKYWKETIAFIIFLFLFFIIISFIFKTYSLFKYSFRHKGGYYR